MSNSIKTFVLAVVLGLTFTTCRMAAQSLDVESPEVAQDSVIAETVELNSLPQVQVVSLPTMDIASIPTSNYIRPIISTDSVSSPVFDVVIIPE